MLSEYETLKQIQIIDPDGGSVAPTPGDYEDFRNYVILRYGHDMWDLYNTNWDTSPTSI